MVDISIIFVNFNTAEMTKKAIDLVRKSSHQLSIEIFVVDNASKDHSVDLLVKEFTDITLISNQTNVGFGRANNQVLSLVSGRYVLLLNTDAFVQFDTIQKTYDFMQDNPNIGILGVKLLGRDGVLQPSCRYFPTPWNLFLNRSGFSKYFTKTRLIDDMDWDHESTRQCDWVPGCYYLVKKEVINKVGLFDPRYFLYYEEVDHCFAAKLAGWDVAYYAGTSIVHIGGESAKTEGSIANPNRQLIALQIESELLYLRKNYGLLSLISHMFLQNIAGLIMVLKNIIKLRPLATYCLLINNISLTWQLFLRTKFGKVATR